jgi:hypothetical protein
MSRDEAVAVGLVVTFAAWGTTHGSLVYGLACRRPRWRALASLLVPPLAPWWGFGEGLRKRAVGWMVLAIAYGLLWIMARS